MADQPEIPVSTDPSETVPEAPRPEEAPAPPPPEATPSEAAPVEPSASTEAPPPAEGKTSNPAATAEKSDPGVAEANRSDVTALLEKVQTLNADDAKQFFDKVEALGHEPPKDEGGNRIVTYEFIEKASVAVISGAYEQVVGAQKREERTSLSPGDKATSKKSGDSGGGGSEDVNEELELTEAQKQEFVEKLMGQGYSVPRDVLGKPKFTRGFLDRLPEYLASEILDAVDANLEGSDLSSSEESEGRRRGSQRSAPRDSQDQQPVLGLRLSKGINYVTNDRGEKLPFREIAHFLRKAFSDSELQKQEEASRERDASLRALIREERRNEEKETNFRKVESLLKMQEMTMRYIPKYNMMPLESDPIELFDKDVGSKFAAPGPSTVRIAEGAKTKDFVHLLAPREYGLRQMDSFATLTSTIDRKISLATMRGSLLSTHLSDMPSTFSQALLDEPSEAMLAPDEQEFDISETSILSFMEKWLTEYMAGYVPRNTFTIRIINMISQREVELRVLKHYTMNEVCHMYMQYEDHPEKLLFALAEYYVWKDIFGRVLNPTKTIVENGLVGPDEILEFQGYRRLPVILLYFRDGFESEPPLPLNPLHALRHREPGLCRNY